MIERGANAVAGVEVKAGATITESDFQIARRRTQINRERPTVLGPKDVDGDGRGVPSVKSGSRGYALSVLGLIVCVLAAWNPAGLILAWNWPAALLVGALSTLQILLTRARRSAT